MEKEKLNKIVAELLEKMRLEAENGELDNKGIPFLTYGYIETNDTQDKEIEYKKIESFLHKYMEYYAEKNKVSIKDLNLTFINYGKTELVYVLKNNSNNYIETLLVKQPIEKVGTVKKEYENLKLLAKKDKKVIDPIDYFCDKDQELYVTPYVNQTRCVASLNTWGMYVPEPNYRFVPFTKEQESIVNTCMIAKLISLYDLEKGIGISNCKLGGGDFMLEKGWENKTLSISNTLNNLYMIAARSSIECSLPVYLDILRDEFSRSTINENQKGLILNLRGRVPMNKNDIESGIELGKILLANQKNNLDKSKEMIKTRQPNRKN